MTDLYDYGERVNNLVKQWIVDEWRSDGWGRNAHLLGCSETTATEVEGEDGEYGCDTGCEYVRLEAFIVCPHGEQEKFTYGDFSRLSSIIEDIEQDYDQANVE